MNSKGGDVAAFKGGGKKGKKGKGMGGKGAKGKWNGSGKGYHAYRYNDYNQSPGKVIGKGLNIFDAWSDDGYVGWNCESND